MTPHWRFWGRRMRVTLSRWFGRDEVTLGHLNAMVLAHPADRYPHAARAHLLAQLNRWDDAACAYRDLVDRFPGHSSDWFNLGFVLESSAQWTQSLEAFSRATAIDPEADRAWYGQGLVLIRLGRLDEALLALKRNVALQPLSPYGWYQLARVHMERGESDEAISVIHHLRGFEPRVAAQLEHERSLHSGIRAA